MKLNKTIVALTVASFLTGCSFVTVPPTNKGKILSPSGYSKDVLEPGKYTTWFRESLILLETNTNTYTEKVKVILADKLTLNVDVRFRGRISGKDNVINSMFNDIRPGEDKKVEFSEVYHVYGRMAVRNKTREIISKYTVEDVHSNYTRISKEIGVVLVEEFKNTPIEVSNVSLGNIQYPKVVTDAIDAAKERELAIKKEEAQAQVNLTKKKNERLLAEAQYQIEITRAEAIRDKNKIIGDGVTPELIELRRLEVMEEMAKNNSAVFMPVEAMSSVGAQVRMFSK